jgi:DNA mismatch repair protein MutL
MGADIHILSEALRNQIAAGEVVERPSSALKELLENAVDAGAQNISIELEEAGFTKILVRDDGSGMSKENLSLSVKRHATSKILTKEDLICIQSLGFRGEALASIASVSLFTIMTKQASQLSGLSLEVHAGHECDIQDCSMQDGTQVLVEDLFMNVPVRKKFLKTQATELKYCHEIIEDLALCFPAISFDFSHNKKRVFKLEGASFQERMKDLVNMTMFERLIPCDYHENFISIGGYVSKPGEVFKTRKYQKIFVNKRAVKDSTISAAIHDAFHSFLEKGSYPAYYLFIQINEDLIDVNIHPRKSEVRFADGRSVFQAVRKGLLAAFEKKHKEFQAQDVPYSFSSASIKNTSVDQVQSFPSFTAVASPQYVSQGNYKQRNPIVSFSKKDFASSSMNEASSSHLSCNINDNVSPENISDDLCGYKIIGQAAKKFIILEKNEIIVFLDQHAVHERARYDDLIKDYKNKEITSQKLLLEEVIQCSHSETLSIKENISILIRMGFDLEEFGGNDFKIIALPIGLSIVNIKETVLRICEELDQKGESREKDKDIEKALTYISCRGSVMFGDTLGDEELKQIVIYWLKNAKGLTCPHGRPLGFEMTVQEMEKKVGR